ncbi:MAG TPA: hypothetical protein VNK91_03865 [Burkholderiaceae bacterium]|nr:hypothetical protein [Burkholderiaceae bacterium]
MARAALSKLAGDDEGAAASAAASPAPSPGDKLKFFVDRADSGAITFRLGERFTGPGPLTVGWLGAKKQVVLPAGEWVVLSAFDHPWGTVKGTTLVFGKFAGDRIAAALRVSTNRHPITRQSWPAMDACEKPDAGRLYQWRKANTAWRRECMAVVAVKQPFAPNSDSSVQTLASLSRMGARVEGFALVARIYLSDDVNGMLFVERIDWPAIALGKAAGLATDWTPEGVRSNTQHGQYLRDFVAWTTAYRAFVLEGFRRELTDPDLQPGVPVARLGSLAGVGDFDPLSSSPRR